MVDTKRLARHRREPHQELRTPIRRRGARLAAIVVIGCIAIALIAFVVPNAWHPNQAAHRAPQRHNLPITPSSYIGVYSHDSPDSFAGVQAFTKSTGVKPRVVVYYSGWMEPFQASFATTVARNGAVPLVQMNPTKTSVAAIAAGRYDDYLNAYAKAVRTYHRSVILSFGHEMNGHWYTWGYTHTSPKVFVAAWRHIVKVFHAWKAQNVTWLWTINTIHKHGNVPSPGPWWPGNSYVNWVGIDGYFTDTSSVFASVFGPTIVYVRGLTHRPILITETSATPANTQPTKIGDLYSGIHLYRLLGFVWFNSIDKVDWRLNSPAAFAAFRRGAQAYRGPAS